MGEKVIDGTGSGEAEGKGGVGEGEGVQQGEEEGGEKAEVKSEIVQKTAPEKDSTDPNPTRAAMPRCNSTSDCIPGSSLRTAQQVAAFESAMSCITWRGRWRKSPEPRWIPWDLHPHHSKSHPNYGTCDHIHAKERKGVYGRRAEQIRLQGKGRWNVRPELMHIWASDRKCPFAQFDREGFCRAVGGRNIVLVGDASQLALHDVLLNHLVSQSTLSSAGNLGDAWETGEKACSVAGHQLCGDVAEGGAFPFTFTMRVVHNNLLSADLPGGGIYNSRWLAHLASWNASIIILNKGLEPRLTPKYLETLNFTLTRLREVAPDALVLWRNTWRGHANCSAAQGRAQPLTQRPDAATEGSQWAFIPPQNEAAKDVLKRFGVVYMDLDTPLSMRPDGHLRNLDGSMDCYFYCIPGPVDHFAGLLYNTLLLLQRHSPSLSSSPPHRKH